MHDDATTSEFGSDEQLITEALAAITARRAVIEQAKGMLMLVYGVDADAAFDVLRKQSQDVLGSLRKISADFVREARQAGAVTIELNLESSRKGHGLFDIEIEGKAGDCVPTFVGELLKGRIS